MNDYLEPYEDMSAYSFAVAEEFVEPITNALCKTMGFVFDRKENLKVFPNMILSISLDTFSTQNAK